MRTPDLEIEPGPCGPGGGAFGDAIASDGDRVIIGAPLQDGDGEPAACVGLLGDDGVTWEGALRPRPGDRFPEHYASAVALRGSIAVVGQLGGDSGDGPVHVFERRATGWERAQLISNPDPDGCELDDLGFALALDGDRLLVCARMSSMVTEQGGVLHDFERTGGAFSHRGTVASGDADVFEMGCSLQVSGSTVMVGADMAHRRGAVYVFERGADGRLARTARVDGPDAPESVDGGFGRCLALDGDRLAVGADTWGLAGERYVGAVWVFARDASQRFVHRCTLRSPSPGASQRFGASVAWDGASLVVGEPGASAYEGTAWRFDDVLGPPRPTRLTAGRPGRARFGERVHVTSSFVLVGAPDARRVFAFRR